MKGRYYVYIIYLIIVTFVVTTVSFSRYSTTVEATGSVSVAKPVISYLPRSAALNGQPVTDISGGIALSDIKAGDVMVYKFDICNFEESSINQVLLKYRLTVSFDPNTVDLPLIYNLEPDDIYEQAGGQWIYMGFGEAITHSYTLTVSWDVNDDNPMYIGKEQKIRITIDTQQADN
jgi:hypothetical protein